MPHRKTTCVYRRILRLVPKVFRNDPWQVMWCLAWLGMGLATGLAMFFPSASGAVDKPLHWDVLRGLWSACFLLGSLFQLRSLQRPTDGALERLGIASCGLGALVYGLSLLNAGNPAGYALAVVFLLIALGHLIVLIAAEATRRFATATQEL